jgi:hypothetical protein
MHLETLRLIRNILLRTAAVSYLFVMLTVPITFFFSDSLSAYTANLLHTTPAEYNILVANFYTSAKFYVIFILLSPALALHWTIKTNK